jgi:hypothetical protein
MKDRQLEFNIAIKLQKSRIIFLQEKMCWRIQCLRINSQEELSIWTYADMPFLFVWACIPIPNTEYVARSKRRRHKFQKVAWLATSSK